MRSAGTMKDLIYLNSQTRKQTICIFSPPFSNKQPSYCYALRRSRDRGSLQTKFAIPDCKILFDLKPVF